MRNRIYTAFLLMAILILSACGGSEDGGTDPGSGEGPSTPSPEASPTVAPSPSPTISPTLSPTPESSPVATPSQTEAPIPSPTPVVSPIASPSPAASPTPVSSPIVSPTPVSSPVASPSPFPPEPIDQCDTTAQCRNVYGNSATDCLNSQSALSICMCGSERCDAQLVPSPSPTPLITPSPSPTPGAGSCAVQGDLQQWHRVELLCEGYTADEADDETFTDHRFNVTFTQNGTEIVVPGHFAADGNAADSGATQGDMWRAYFSPPSTGNWTYQVSLRIGDEIVVDDAEDAGEAASAIDGLSGSFNIVASTASGRDMRARGLLQHLAGERYLRFAGDGSVYLEGGMDSPENIFGYSGFDNTEKFLDSADSCKGILHDFASHEDDWNTGDPSWDDERGKSLIGLVNYIALKGVNAIYVMTNTVKGDGCDAHPWTEYNTSNTEKRFDVSKLDQWERVFAHMTAKGILVHIMTQETENDQMLNDGDLGLERKLYYRELISRFAHHPALQWNLGEENTNTAAQREAYANFIKALDPYNHPIFMHTYPGQQNEYTSLLGLETFDGPTLQFSAIPEDASSSAGVYGMTVDWLNQSTSNGHPWVVTVTEASGGDAPTPNQDVTPLQRIYWMWANAMAGGGGFEWYLKRDGDGHAYDLAVEDLREFDQLWDQTGYFVTFFRDILQGDLGVSMQSLQRDNALTSTTNDWVLSDPGSAYVIFLREGGTTTINLPDDKAYRANWFNPRTGELTSGGTPQGNGDQSIGNPPSETTQDWVVILTPEGDDNNGLHPDIVRVADIPIEDIIRSPADNWKDSYSVGDQCYCDSTFDHNIGGILVETGQGTMTVLEACERIGPGPGAAGRPVYNDIQCGNGPANDAGDEDYCPGRVDLEKTGCPQIGPTWKIPGDAAEGAYREIDGLIIMEAENTDSDLDLWLEKTDVNGFTGESYVAFSGNSPLNGSAKSPLEYTFTVSQSGYYYLHMYVARERVIIGEETRNDVANDCYIRMDGEYEAGPSAGDSHGDDAPIANLKSNTKYFGGNHNSFV